MRQLMSASVAFGALVMVSAHNTDLDETNILQLVSDLPETKTTRAEGAVVHEIIRPNLHSILATTMSSITKILSTDVDDSDAERTTTVLGPVAGASVDVPITKMDSLPLVTTPSLGAALTTSLTSTPKYFHGSRFNSTLAGMLDSSQNVIAGYGDGDEFFVREDSNDPSVWFILAPALALLLFVIIIALLRRCSHRNRRHTFYINNSFSRQDKDVLIEQAGTEKGLTPIKEVDSSAEREGEESPMINDRFPRMATYVSPEVYV